MNQYPKYLHHATEPARIVNSAEEEQELGKGWEDSPAKHGVITHPSLDQLATPLEVDNTDAWKTNSLDLSTTETKDDLISFAERASVQIDKRWSAERIRQTINETLTREGAI